MTQTGTEGCDFR